MADFLQLLEKQAYQRETLSFEDAKRKAFWFLGMYLMQDGPDDDYWYGLADNWDLNIWWDEELGIYMATLYPVIDGETDYSTFYPMYSDLGGQIKGVFGVFPILTK